ncbi:hypothetical protein [Brassicibacter mesophilus]|uniref:hypothetical protein n=1 Tax=Brassicibacter mesophilus TaxID=745119 RepID=UPI003D1A8FC4
MKMKFEKFKTEELLLKLGLYEEIDINTDYILVDYDYDDQFYNGISRTGITYSADFRRLINFISEKDVIYGYCPYCKKNLSFNVISNNISQELKKLSFYEYENTCNDPETMEFIFSGADNKFHDRLELLKKECSYFFKQAVCSYEPSHQLVFVYHLNILKNIEGKYTLKLSKIGQNPSIIEIEEINLNKYKKLLEKMDSYIDYKIGCGLISHGLGVGPYAYMRRVFEKLILYKFNKHKDEIELDNSDFKELHMEDKLKVLKKYLPEFLFDTKNIYKILSAGIHILSEKDCKEMLPVVKNTIEIILDEEIETIEKEKIKKKTKETIASYTNKVKNLTDKMA